MERCTEKDTCRNCGRTGHYERACKNRTRCVNCAKVGRNDQHGVYSRECPLVRAAEAKGISRVNY